MNSSDEIDFKVHAPPDANISDRDARRREFLLVWGLRLMGVVDMLALIAVVMPIEWMSRINDLCGLGPLPESKIVGYLARTTSALYALHGALILFISCDVARYRPLISFLGLIAVIHGVILLGIDLAVGMPFFWTLLEAPSFVFIGLVVLWIQGRKKPTIADVSA